MHFVGMVIGDAEKLRCDPTVVTPLWPNSHTQDKWRTAKQNS